jgi:uncharacterized protein (DUF433 family)
MRIHYHPDELPNYGMIEAARYLHVPHSTLQFWTSGGEPIVQLAQRGHRPLLSFKNLVECYVVQGVRTVHKVRVNKIRNAAGFLRRNFTSLNPLADYDLICDGVDLFLEIEGTLINLSLHGQSGMKPILYAHLRRVERDEAGVARRLFPYKNRAHMTSPQDAPRLIVIDPMVSFGRPILRDSGIPSSILASRFKAGDSIAVLADSYDRQEDEIRAAVEWEIGRAA